MELITILQLYHTFSIIKLNKVFIISNQSDIDLDILEGKASIIVPSVLSYVADCPLKKHYF